MKYLIVFLMLLLFFTLLPAQNKDSFMGEPTNSVNGGVGITFIGDTAYTTFTIAPEFAFGKLGIGLNIELLFNNEDGFKFRKEGWDKGAGAFRMIRYLRWGLKGDPFYTRIGSLQSATLGNGFIMGYYSNESSYDRRKIGLELDMDFGIFGLESMTSNLGNIFEIVGGRLFVRPLHTTEIPVLENLEVGGTYVTDLNPDNDKDTNDGVYEWGADLTIPIIKMDIFNWKIYSDYAKINNYGSGTAFGTLVSVPNIIGAFGIYAKMEKRFLGDRFLPNYFNTLYEIDRRDKPAAFYFPDDDAYSGYYMTKQDYLALAQKTEGIFGELAGQVLGKIRLAGSYQHIQNTTGGGIMHLEAKSNDLIPGVRLMWTYDKIGIDDFEDARTLDSRSVAVGEIGYKAYPFLYVTLQYRWYWVPVKDEITGEVISYKGEERFQPGISFSMTF
jgi:hypothetical protein